MFWVSRKAITIIGHVVVSDILNDQFRVFSPDLKKKKNSVKKEGIKPRPQ